jgi:hypothetical protein
MYTTQIDAHVNFLRWQLELRSPSPHSKAHWIWWRCGVPPERAGGRLRLILTHHIEIFLRVIVRI